MNTEIAIKVISVVKMRKPFWFSFYLLPNHQFIKIVKLIIIQMCPKWLKCTQRDLKAERNHQNEAIRWPEPIQTKYSQMYLGWD